MRSEVTSTGKPTLHLSPGGVLVVEGLGAALRVDGSHLKVRSGTGRRIAEGRFSRVTRPKLKRVVVIAGPAGYLSIPAVRWIRDIGADLVVLAPDGEVLLAPGRMSPDDARLRRQQALAASSDLGLAISRRLIEAKIAGQRRVVAERFPAGPARFVKSLDRLAAETEQARSIDELRQTEALASAVYFTAWRDRVRIRWARRDETRIPDHWRAFTGRGSPLANGPRMAGDAINSLLNLASALLEVETVLALRTVGLDPGIAFGLHSDQRARSSAADDVMEPARPAAEELVLDLIADRVFPCRDFAENSNGHVRIAPTLARSLVEAWIPELSRAVAPWAEMVATEIGKTAGITRLATRLTESNRSAGRDPYRKAPRQARTRERVAEHTVPRACRECGEVLRSRSRLLCDACAALQRIESVQNVGRATLVAMRARGEADPARTPEARAKMGATQSKRARERAEWERAHPGPKPDPAVFRTEILPGLAVVPVERIASETGLSLAHVWRIRRGERTPHPRFWPALRSLATQPSDVGRTSSPRPQRGTAPLNESPIRDSDRVR